MLHLLCLLATANAIAQTDVTGMVVDKESNEPITRASVIVKGADGKIKKYTTSKSDGGFTMSLPSVAGCRLEVSMMSFATHNLFGLRVQHELSAFKSYGGVTTDASA